MPTTPRIAVLGTPDGWSTKKLADAVGQVGAQVVTLDAEELACDAATGRVTVGEHDLTDFHAVLVKKLGRAYSPEIVDRVTLLAYAESRGARVMSPAAAIASAVSRLSCTLKLRANGIPMPPTVITESLPAAEDAVRRFGVSVVKPLFTSKARGMELIRADANVADRLAAHRDQGNRLLYVQQFVEAPGRDFGVCFVNGAYLASYARVAPTDSWHTSTSGGGRYAAADPSDAIIALADRAQAPFGLDFTCVDVVESSEGPFVYEVSAFGGFRGLLDGAGVDAARVWAEAALRRIGG